MDGWMDGWMHECMSREWDWRTTEGCMDPSVPGPVRYGHGPRLEPTPEEMNKWQLSTLGTDAKTRVEGRPAATVSRRCGGWTWVLMVGERTNHSFVLIRKLRGLLVSVCLVFVCSSLFVICLFEFVYLFVFNYFAHPEEKHRLTLVWRVVNLTPPSRVLPDIR